MKQRVLYAIIICASLAFAAGCGGGDNGDNGGSGGNGGETHKFTVDNPETGEKQQVVVNNNEDNKTVSITVGEGEDKQEVSVNTNDNAVLDALPDGLPLPDDYKMLEDQSGLITSDGYSGVFLAYVTNTGPEEIMTMYRDFIKGQGGFSITELGDSSGLIALTDKETYNVSLMESSVDGYATEVVLHWGKQ